MNAQLKEQSDSIAATLEWQHPTGKIPRRLAIIGCGPTNKTWHAANFTYEPQVPSCDEVWTLNKGLRTIRSDLGFVMDDMTGEAMRSATYAKDLNGLRIPVITSILDEETKARYPDMNLHRYPLEAVTLNVALRVALLRGATPEQCIRERDRIRAIAESCAYYLHNSLPYMLAYALYIGVPYVMLFGCDYTYPGQDIREDDRANCEYWVGMLRAFGVEVWVTDDTTLLNACKYKRVWLYGFGARQPTLPTPWAADIERELKRLGG